MTSLKVYGRPAVLMVNVQVKFSDKIHMEILPPMGTLTDAKLRGFRANGRIQKISDGNGLYAYLGAKGRGISWQMAYRFDGRQKTLTLGKYPGMGLAEARRGCFEARRLLERGIDPGEEKKAAKEASRAAERDALLTFAAVGNQWFEKHCADTVPATQRKTRRYLDTLFEYFGNEPFAGLERKTLVDAAKDVQDRISPHAAHRVAGILNRICIYAWDCGYADRNLADRISSALKPQRVTHRAALIAPQEVGNLLRKIHQYEGEGFSVAYCLRILPYLALRSEEVRGARWTEIDLDAAIWTIPAMRHEHGGGMKMRVEHSVPLSRQVAALFRELKKHQASLTTGECELCFPSPRAKGRHITSESLLVALKVIHGSGNISVHGFRTTFSTLARERGFHPAHIEKQLAHKEGNSVIEAYDRSTYFEQRRVAMQKWADYLDGLRNPAAPERDGPRYIGYSTKIGW
jgi:integrase